MEYLKQNSFKKKVEESLRKLIVWIKINGISGYDPYDIKGNPRVINLSKKNDPVSKIFKSTLSFLEVFFPKTLRFVLGEKKKRNAKGIGLLSRAFLDLYQITKKDYYLDNARELLSWLKKTISRNYQGSCWGYPFDWQSLIYFPKGTPCGVITSIVGDAFYKYYLITNEDEYLDMCDSICRFILHDLNIDIISSQKVCFSYTPLDNSHVLNANLFVSDFLIKIGEIVGNKEYISLGTKALNYTLGEQNSNGSFYYFGRKDKFCYNLGEGILKTIDNYHTGFLLRCLYSIYLKKRNDTLRGYISKGLSFYLNNFFEESKIPKITPHETYPVDIHSCAEAILCLSTLSDEFPECENTLKKVTSWTINEMQTKAGWFIYAIKQRKGFQWKIKIPYIRWGQAWMLRALSNYLQKK